MLALLLVVASVLRSGLHGTDCGAAQSKSKSQQMGLKRFH